jgi:predicted  nucleic acid-binding Zn-ribbon protein
MSINQAELADLKRKQATLAASGQVEAAADVEKQVNKFHDTARKIRKQAADAETATDTAVSDDTVVEKSTSRHR